MIKIKDIIQYLESFAPPAYQEEYDNSGLITGNQQREMKGALITLDCIEEVVDEAIQKKCNLIIAHHPILFRGLKKLTGSNYIERTVIKAIKNDIAIYAIHTNLDNISKGVNKKIADKLGLSDTKILRPKSDTLTKLTTFIPKENTENVMSKLHEAGAGMIGNYKSCSFRIEGTGTFLPVENANPTIGELGQLEKVNENRIELIFPTYIKTKILNTLFKAHPYEEVAYYLHDLANNNNEVGSGMIGELPKSIKSSEFLDHIKSNLSVKVIRHTSFVKEFIKKVALCGGSGSFLLRDAIAQGADIFISGDFKYHEFFDADNRIIIADVGHYESEQFTKELIYENINEKFANIALHFTEVNTNPIFYA
ncbi:MAG: Nif3-like dinuclear metal center hexameric protein [Cyclobacteriaceae bacterium]|nr:Nif3-like dinuclear metal center hexameric protein [Cyclobacteriaceae bacterium]